MTVISVGTKMGPYEILAPLGAGGMGEVWRAKDGRLNREVAIKVLPADFTADVDRLRRFELEAKSIIMVNVFSPARDVRNRIMRNLILVGLLPTMLTSCAGRYRPLVLPAGPLAVEPAAATAGPLTMRLEPQSWGENRGRGCAIRARARHLQLYVLRATNHGAEPAILDPAAFSLLNGESLLTGAEAWRMTKPGQVGTMVLLGLGIGGGSLVASQPTSGIDLSGELGAAVFLACAIPAATWGISAKIYSSRLRRDLAAKAFVPVRLAPGESASGLLFLRTQPGGPPPELAITYQTAAGAQYEVILKPTQ